MKRSETQKTSAEACKGQPEMKPQGRNEGETAEIVQPGPKGID